MATHQKKLANGSTVLFLDESIYRFIPFITHTWAHADDAPVLRHVYRTWRGLSAISAIALRIDPVTNEIQTRLFFRLHPGKTVNGTKIRDFLHQVRYQVDGHVIIIWDNASHHKGKPVRTFLDKYDRFQSEHLPGYCPELNPDEDVWNWTKTKDLANQCPTDGDELVSMVRGALRRMQQRPRLLRWCLHESELPWGNLLN